MIVHRFAKQCALWEPSYRFIMSDLHLGSPAADHERIVADLVAATSVNAKVLINGDVFDAINFKDKRFEANTLHPALRGKKDLEGAIVDLACELLSPHADQIDVIGVGNHEEAWIKYGASDPVARLLERLNAGRTHQIRHGSFWGYILTEYACLGQTATHRLLYYHGAGGDSPVTKGTVDFHRKGRNWSYDAMTFGHKHNLLVATESIVDVTRTGQVYERAQLNLQTGSYYRNYQQVGQGDPLDYSYAASKAHSPKPIGGLYLIMRPHLISGTDTLTVRQDYASDIVVPWARNEADQPGS